MTSFSPCWIVVDFETFRGQFLSALVESYTWSVSVSERVVRQGESQEEKGGSGELGSEHHTAMVLTSREEAPCQ